MTSTSRLDPDRHPARVRRVPDARPMAPFRTPIRGHAFAARPPDVTLAVGAAARLVREPDNPRDGFAVAVWVDGDRPWRAGYLDSVVAARLAPRLDAGERLPAALDGWVDAPGGWRRPLLAVGAAPDRRPDGSAGGVDARARRRGSTLWGRPPGSTRRVIGPASDLR